LRSTTAIAVAIFTVAAASAQTTKKPANRVPLGLLPIQWPADNPYSPDKVELGRLLYFDKRLSADDSVSCATCHVPEKGFTDGASVSTGICGQKRP
jgi:cytochrome c peroxidase